MFTLWRSLQYGQGLYLCRAVMYIFLFKTKSSKLLFIVESFRNRRLYLNSIGTMGRMNIILKMLMLQMQQKCMNTTVFWVDCKKVI